MPLARVRELALLIIQEYQKKDYLFSHLPADFATPLSPASLSLLKDFETQLLSTHPPSTSPATTKLLRDWLGLLGGLKDALLRIVKEGRAKVKGDERLDALVNHDLLDFGELSSSDLTQALPPSILVSQLSSCILYEARRSEGGGSKRRNERKREAWVC